MTCNGTMCLVLCGSATTVACDTCEGGSGELAEVETMSIVENSVG